jgi:hypothetical protein
MGTNNKKSKKGKARRKEGKRKHEQKTDTKKTCKEITKDRNNDRREETAQAAAVCVCVPGLCDGATHAICHETSQLDDLNYFRLHVSCACATVIIVHGSRRCRHRRQFLILYGFSFLIPLV